MALGNVLTGVNCSNISNNSAVIYLFLNIVNLPEINLALWLRDCFNQQ